MNNFKKTIFRCECEHESHFKPASLEGYSYNISSTPEEALESDWRAVWQDLSAAIGKFEAKEQRKAEDDQLGGLNNAFSNHPHAYLACEGDVQIKTPNGTYNVCTTCANTHMVFSS